MMAGSCSDVLMRVNLGIARQGFEQIFNILASATATCITSDSAIQLGVLQVDNRFQHTCAPAVGAVLGSGAAALTSMLPSQTCNYQRVGWSVGQSLSLSPFWKGQRIQDPKKCQNCKRYARYASAHRVSENVTNFRIQLRSIAIFYHPHLVFHPPEW